MPEPAARGRGRRLVGAALSAVGTSLVVAGIAVVVRANLRPVRDLDEGLIRAATDFTRSHDGFKSALLIWQEAFQPKWVYAVGTLVCLIVWRRHHLTGRALWAFVTMMLSWNLALDIKILVQRARPVVQDAIAIAPGYSFPSGHAANTAAAATVLTILVWPLLGRRARWIVVPAASVAVLLTAADRVFLGVHYPTDVTAGVVFGVGIALSSYAAWSNWRPKASSPAGTASTPLPRES